MTAAKDKYILCIDLGTSGCKSAIFTLQGECLGFDFAGVPVHLLPGGGAEQDPEDWWNAVKNSTRKLWPDSSASKDNIMAVSVNTQWSGTVAVDKDANPLMKSMIWLDTRGAEQIEALNKGPIKISGYNALKLYRWIRLTGGAPGMAGKDPLAHIPFIKTRFPDIYRRTFKFLEVKDYINLCLTGKFLSTYDSITLHWLTDNRRLSRIDYHPHLLKMTGMERDKFPDLVRPVDIIGTLTREAAHDLGLPESVKVIGGSPDTVAPPLAPGLSGIMKAIHTWGHHPGSRPMSPIKKPLSSRASPACLLPSRAGIIQVKNHPMRPVAFSAWFFRDTEGKRRERIHTG